MRITFILCNNSTALFIQEKEEKLNLCNESKT